MIESSDSTRLVRFNPRSEAACSRCHSKMQHISLTGHGFSGLAKTGLDSDACRPCHSVHANPETLGRMLLPKTSASASDDTPISNSICVSCHRKEGPAKPPAIVTHPVVPMMNVPASTGGGAMPLFDESGHVAPQGTVGCLPCPVPHGRPIDEKTAVSIPDREHGAMRLLVRPFAPPNICTSCHGADALPRFLYFHDPNRRRGPLTNPSENTYSSVLD